MGGDFRKYVDLRIDSMKLKAVDGLSVGFGRFLSVMTMLILAAVSLMAFAFGTVLLLGDIIGSWAAAAFIVGGFFLLLMLLVILAGKRLYVNLFVKTFIDIFYDKD